VRAAKKLLGALAFGRRVPGQMLVVEGVKEVK
jgi:hypothetical protein